MNWGVIGYGAFAPKFLSSLSSIKSETIKAIATRSGKTAALKVHPNAIIYSNYQDLFQDTTIDIIYICVTHNFHKENVLHALKAGKHVVCEKPLGINTSETEEMIKSSVAENKFLLEGMWTRFLPAYKKLKKLISNGKIGEIKYITANFGFKGLETKERLSNPILAGGATFDVGVYPIAFATDFLGEPDQIFSNKIMTDQGVDSSAAISLFYKNGTSAQLHCSVGLETSKNAFIYGTKGYIKIPNFWRMQEFTLHKPDDKILYEFPFKSIGYYHEIKAAIKAIKNGNIETKRWPHADSLLNAKIVEEIL